MEGVKKTVVWSYYIGISIVFISHLYMIFMGLPADKMMGHSIINLIAGGLLAYSWFGR